MIRNKLFYCLNNIFNSQLPDKIKEDLYKIVFHHAFFPIKVCIVGSKNCGKSSTIQALTNIPLTYVPPKENIEQTILDLNLSTEQSNELELLLHELYQTKLGKAQLFEIPDIFSKFDQELSVQIFNIFEEKLNLNSNINTFLNKTLEEIFFGEKPEDQEDKNSSRKGNPTVFLVVVDSNTDQYEQTYNLINTIKKLKLDKVKIMVVLNKADLLDPALTAIHWTDQCAQPSEVLQELLNTKAENLQNLILEHTNIKTKVIPYCACLPVYNQEKVDKFCTYNLLVVLDQLLKISGASFSELDIFRDWSDYVQNYLKQDNLTPTLSDNLTELLNQFNKETSNLDFITNTIRKTLSQTAQNGEEKDSLYSILTSRDRFVNLFDGKEPKQKIEVKELEVEKDHTKQKDFLTSLSEGILYTDLQETDKTLLLKNIFNLRKKEINLLVMGVTGCGKSSTINALFDTEVAEVGEGYQTKTKCIDKYVLSNLVIWDTPGLGANIKEDQKYTKSLIKALKAVDEDNTPIIDLVLVILDASSRDFSSSFNLINNVIIPNLGENRDNRILIALNQADNALKGRHWDVKNNQPDPILVNFLDEQIKSIQQCIYDSTNMNITPIYYSAGFKDSGEEQCKPYNLSKLLMYIVKNTPVEKRLVYMNNLNKNKEVWEDHDQKMDYTRETEKAMLTTVTEYLTKGSDVGSKIGSLFGQEGKTIGHTLGGTIGIALGIYNTLF